MADQTLTEAEQQVVQEVEVELEVPQTQETDRSHVTVRHTDEMNPVTIAKATATLKEMTDALTIQVQSHKARALGKGKGKKIQKLCFHYLRGQCTKGEACESRHPEEPERKRIFGQMQKTPCKYGKDCKRMDCIFVHSERDGVTT